MSEICNEFEVCSHKTDFNLYSSISRKYAKLKWTLIQIYVIHFLNKTEINIFYT